MSSSASFSDAKSTDTMADVLDAAHDYRCTPKPDGPGGREAAAAAAAAASSDDDAAPKQVPSAAAAPASPSSPDKQHTTKQGSVFKDPPLLIYVGTGMWDYEDNTSENKKLVHIGISVPNGKFFAFETSCLLVKNAVHAVDTSVGGVMQPLKNVHGQPLLVVKKAILCVDFNRGLKPHASSTFALAVPPSPKPTHVIGLITGTFTTQTLVGKKPNKSGVTQTYYKNDVPLVTYDDENSLHHVKLAVWGNINRADFAVNSVVQVFGAVRQASQYTTGVCFDCLPWALVETHVKAAEATHLKALWAEEQTGLASVAFVFSNPDVKTAPVTPAAVEAAAAPKKPSSSSSGEPSSASSSSSSAAAAPKKRKVVVDVVDHDDDE